MLGLLLRGRVLLRLLSVLGRLILILLILKLRLLKLLLLGGHGPPVELILLLKLLHLAQSSHFVFIITPEAWLPYVASTTLLTRCALPITVPEAGNPLA